MIEFVTPDRYGEFAGDLAQMHRLRYRVFKERLGWDVDGQGGVEKDAFDALDPVYLLYRADDGEIRGCVRLLPSTGPTMLRDTFAALLDGRPISASDTVWESSRFALHLAADAPKAAGGLAQATYELFSGMIEFGLSRRLTDIVTVTDVRMERILQRAGWPLRRLTEPAMLGATRTVAGYLSVSRECARRVRTRGGLDGPVLSVPAASAAA
ncbi:acyl-homoserine-lactone synthase [Thalassobaculum sp.]|uniref:acyl-homoserine-lactone synthase n=1 Tax=Thalassobaculum sp. TaxID=2022740 RepID=UPI0032F07ABD